MVQFDTIIIFSSGTILGYLVKVLLDNFLAQGRNRQERKIKIFNEAAQVFRDAFTPELTKIKSTQNIASHITGLYSILEQALHRHESAVIVFKEHLRAADIPRFEKAWEEYRYPDGTPEHAPDMPFIDYVIEGDESEMEKRILASKKIEALLKFAKPK